MKMKKHKLGNTDLLTSDLCIGTMDFGKKTPSDISIELLDMFYEAGGNYIDTAAGYAFGESEKIIGKWMKNRNNREDLVIASKAGWDKSKGFPPIMISTPEAIKRECDESLERLGIEYIDIFYLHADYREGSLEAQLGALMELVNQGKIRYFAASNFKPWRMEEARHISLKNGWNMFSCMQRHYSYIRPKPLLDSFPWRTPTPNPDLLEYCSVRNLPIMGSAPLQKGVYSRDDKKLNEFYDHSDSHARIQFVRKLAAEAGVTANQLVLQWILKTGVNPIVAVSKKEQMEEVLKITKIKVDDELFDKMNDFYS